MDNSTNLLRKNFFFSSLSIRRIYFTLFLEFFLQLKGVIGLRAHFEAWNYQLHYYLILIGVSMTCFQIYCFLYPFFIVYCLTICLSAGVY